MHTCKNMCAICTTLIMNSIYSSILLVVLTGVYLNSQTMRAAGVPGEEMMIQALKVPSGVPEDMGMQLK